MPANELLEVLAALMGSLPPMSHALLEGVQSPPRFRIGHHPETCRAAGISAQPLSFAGHMVLALWHLRPLDLLIDQSP